MNALDMLIRCTIGQQNALEIPVPPECISRPAEASDSGVWPLPQGEGVIAGYHALGTFPAELETIHYDDGLY